MSSLLAKTRLKRLVPSKLHDLIVQSEAEGDSFLLQSHYHVEGSLEEHLGVVRTAFKAWCREKENESCRYSYILGTRPDTLIFYSESWYDSTCTYYTMGYTVTAGAVTFDGTPVQVEAKIVIEALGLTPDSAGADDDLDTMMMANTPAPATPVAQVDLSAPAVHGTPLPAAPAAATDPNGTVPGPDVIDLNAPAVHSTPLPTVPGEPTAANEPGVAVTPPLATVVAGTQTALAPHDAAHLLQSVSVDEFHRQIGTVIPSSLRQGDESKGENKQHLHFDCIFTRGSIINSQGQVYTTDLWAKRLPGMNEQAASGKFTGCLEHQSEKGLLNASIRWLEFSQSGDDFLAKGLVIPTDDGKNLQAIMEAGVQVDFSTYGYGSAKEGQFQGKTVQIIQDDFACTRVDAVKHGSSFGSTVTSTHMQGEPAPATDPVTQNNTDMSTPAALTTTPTPEQKAQALAAAATLRTAREELIKQSQEKYTAVGVSALQAMLDKATDAAGLFQAFESFEGTLGATFAKPAVDPAAPVVQSQGHTVAPNFWIQGDTAPTSVDEMFDRLVEPLPDKWNCGNPATEVVGQAHYLKSPKLACKQWLKNIEGLNRQNRAGAQTLLRLSQGAKMDQALGTGAVIADGHGDPGGAPVSTHYIFPLIRDVFPALIANEIASIQPMDRPTGKMFFMHGYRVVDGDGADIRMDTTSLMSSSFANYAAEGNTPKRMRFALESVDVVATDKALNAEWSIQEQQDLMAYHGLDASGEVMAMVAKEIAIEWNLEVINDMVDSASAGELTYGTQAPDNFTQTEWDAYAMHFIQKLSITISTERHAPATHVLLGPDAAFALSKALKLTLNMAGTDSDLTTYAGFTVFPVMNTALGRIRFITTDLWANTANAAKALVLRRGTNWSETGYVFSPYADYISPILTNPGNFGQSQGILSRAAHQVVQSNTMAVLTVANQEGVPLF